MSECVISLICKMYVWTRTRCFCVRVYVCVHQKDLTEFVHTCLYTHKYVWCACDLPACVCVRAYIATSYSLRESAQFLVGSDK